MVLGLKLGHFEWTNGSYIEGLLNLCIDRSQMVAMGVERTALAVQQWIDPH
jgi:hypothetical protein